MKVTVTGGAGELGQFVVRDLIEHGYEVVSVDQRIIKDAPYKQIVADLSDLGQIYGCISGSDAIIHLGAIRAPGANPNEVVFRNNVMGTFNVFEAAACLNLKRVVWASSINVLGFGFAYRKFSPVYLPIDENHPNLPQDCYGLSKLVGEEIAAAFTRRTEIPCVSLRFTWIGNDELYLKYLPGIWKDPGSWRVALWGFVDARDAATACRLSLESEIDGHESMYIGADTTIMKIPSMDLIQEYFPDSEVRKEIKGTSSLFDCRKAKRILGFQPKHHWKDLRDLQ